MMKTTSQYLTIDMAVHALRRWCVIVLPAPYPRAGERLTTIEADLSYSAMPPPKASQTESFVARLEVSREFFPANLTPMRGVSFAAPVFMKYVLPQRAGQSNEKRTRSLGERLDEVPVTKLLWSLLSFNSAVSFTVLQSPQMIEKCPLSLPPGRPFPYGRRGCPRIPVGTA